MADKKKLQTSNGKRVRTLREKQNISQQELAAPCNFK